MVGPLGKAAEIKKLGTVIMVGGGTGVAILHHITKAFKEAGNYVISIIGAREKDLLILEEEMRLLSDEMIVTIRHKRSLCNWSNTNDEIRL